MRGAGWLIRHRLHRQLLQLVPLFLVVAIGGTGALVALGAADRTDHAFSDYVARAHVSEAVINPSLDSTDIRRVIGNLPGVRSVTSDSLYFVTGPFDDGHPRPFSELEDASGADIAQIRGSSDGRYLTADRPVVREGRLPTGRNEAFASAAVARRYHVRVGQRLSIAFWNQNPELLGNVDDVVSPLGVEHVRLVGTGTFPDEVLPDKLYPTGRVIMSPDIAARYDDCSPSVPPGDPTLAEAVRALKPGRCSAVSYRYYALEIPGGGRAVAHVFDAYVGRAEALNSRLPSIFAAQDVRYILISTRLSTDRDRIERATRPTVLALFVLGLVAAVVTIAVAGFAFARDLRRADADHLQWWRLGLGLRERVGVVVIPELAAAVAGLVVALAAAWVLSPIGPVGTVRDVDPSPSRRFTAWVLLGVVALLVAMAALMFVMAVPWARRLRRAPVRPSRLAVSLMPRFTRAETAEGIRAAYSGRLGPGVVVGSAVVACAVFLAAVVFGASLSSLVSTPASYGWPWDAGAMSNFGYGGLDVAAARAGLAHDDNVSQWTGLGFTPVTVDRQPIPTVIALGGGSSLDFAVVEGRLPTGGKEVALGSRTASIRGLGVGDRVRLRGDGVRPHRATVTALVVLPSLGAFQSDRLSPGEGMLMPAAGFRRSFVNNNIAFFGLDFANGAPPGRTLAEVAEQVRSWTPGGFQSIRYATPVRPPEIDDAASMRAVPMLVAALLVVTAVIGLAIAVILSVRARRRELAVLQALGFDAGQVRRSVRVQALASVVPAIVVGIPLGIMLGRVLWGAFADELGVVTAISVPTLWVVGTIVGALAVALVASAIPAWVAVRAQPALALRTE